ncbi:small peptidoglycan-associated lipoprotein [Mesobacillus zeae]|uniref:Small peptidoglycan-associated lipoprotein n=1 Tax=Mesobacillus zeae TaxID=1917180 RepID=A0A398BDB8_9BACI|nr:small peptidoglycan-associated lipoprotein [Mesobacillus zeae]
MNEDVKQVVFFSDESNDANEAPYYDAIIELKEDFPDTMQNMVILTPDKADPYYKVFGIDKGPAILILYNDQVSVKVYGQATKEQIIMRIAKELSNDSKRPPH